MKTTIVNIEGNKIQVVIDNDIKEYELADWVKTEYVKLGDADIYNCCFHFLSFASRNILYFFHSFFLPQFK